MSGSYSRVSRDVTDLLSAMLAHRYLINICQHSHVRLCFCVMSDDKSSDNQEKKSQTSEISKGNCSIVLSEYAKNLQGHVYFRYLQKIGVIGVDPACLTGEKLDPECLPLIESTDVLTFLVLETSYYTMEQFKAYKSLESYNYMVSGFITSVQGKSIGNNFVVVGKVRHSQRMNDDPIPIWIIANREGTVLSAHCLVCKAGQAECCSHVGCVLFYIEAWNRIHGKLACTQVKCTWLLPTYVNEVPYSEVQEINFKSARKLKADLDEKIDDLCASFAGQTVKTTAQKTVSTQVPTPTKEEMNALFTNVNKSSKKSVILSLVPKFSEQFVLKSRRIPTLSALFSHENMSLTYPELLEKCCDLEVPLSDSDIDLIEHDTREQSHGAAFFKHRAGRIGASVCYSVTHTNPAQPSVSLIKRICYPQLFKVNSKAVNHGIKNESKAIDAYKSVMSSKHKDFSVKKCGVYIDKDHPWMHATPDFIVTCSCCGCGCGEVKCPITIENCDFQSYTAKKSSCLKSVDGKLQLKRDHQYYYQVQQQLRITGRQYCDFVVCAFSHGTTMFIMERILPDSSHWKITVPKVNKVWRVCILPEVLARWYTRKQHLSQIDGLTPQNTLTTSSVCYCRKQTQGETLCCSNSKCLIKEFHYSCLHITDPVPSKWYCPNCRLLPEFQCKKFKKTKSAVAKNKDSVDALKLDNICVCHSKPSANDRLLKCHSENCQNGKYFHLHCLGYKRMPNNSQSTWMCSSCKVSQATKAKPRSTGPTTCTSDTSLKTEVLSNSCAEITQSTNPVTQSTKEKLTEKNSPINYVLLDSSDEESDVEITGESIGNLNKTAALGDLNESHFDLINLPSGWLDCTIIQQAQILLKKINPLIEGFQRTTLGPIRNFDIVTSEFVQILHTGHMHWVCVSSVGCKPGEVKLYDSLYHDIIEEEVVEQVKYLMADSYIGLVNAPVQQQQNGSDCGVFAIAFSTCLAYEFNPQDYTFDIPRMRPHLSQCLKNGKLTMFPTLRI